jgi:hypothetical protein
MDHNLHLYFFNETDLVDYHAQDFCHASSSAVRALPYLHCVATDMFGIPDVIVVAAC